MNPDFGREIRRLRRRLGLTQTELAERIGAHQSFVSNLERGNVKNPRVSTLVRLAHALNANVEISFSPVGHE